MSKQSSASRATASGSPQPVTQSPKSVVPAKAGTSTPEGSLSPQRLLELYDRVAEAPDAVERLRKFVLDLAVRGKLVAQDPADEPASMLLERIAVEKARLIESGEIRKPRSLGKDSELNKPFPIPDSWKWCRLDTIGAIVGGGTPAASEPENFAEPGGAIPWLTPADLGRFSSLFIKRGTRDLTERGLNSSSATLMPAGTVLFTSRAPIGYVAIAANPIATNQGFKSIVPYVKDCSHFIAIAMRTFAPDIDAKAPGTTFKEVSGKIVAAIPFPLPPLAEQHRIVAKVNDLMALLDRLETTRTRQKTTHNRLTTASLTRLTAPETTKADFPTHARFALDNLDQLTSRAEQIKVLRQTILNLAVRGKLVEQHTIDGSAEKALQAIKSKREEMVQKEQLRREKPLKPVREDEMPFELPPDWVWVRVGELALFTQYGTSEKAAPSDAGVPVLTMGNIQNGEIVHRSEKRIPETSDELPRLYLKKFDLLYNRTNSAELVGKTGLYQGEDDCCTFASYLIRIRLSSNDTSAIYVNLAMNTPYFRETQIIPHIKKQTGQANVSGSALKNMLVPMPPLAEQHRIVARVETLMACCDRMETALSVSCANRVSLLETLMQGALHQNSEYTPSSVG